MFRVEKFLSSMRVSRKLTAGFVLVVALMLTASAYGLVTTRSHVPRLDHMVNVDAMLAFEGADVRAVLLEMRHFEKSMFINIGNAEKIAKNETGWTEHYDEQIHTLETLDKIAQQTADHEMIANIRKLMIAYGAAVRKTVAELRAGTITTTAAAYAAMDSFVEPLDELDDVITKWYEGHEQQTEESGKAIAGGVTSALLFTFIMTLVALIGSFAVAYLLARSIRRPLENAVSGARSVAQGRFEINAPEELGQVQQAFEGIRGLLIEARELKSRVEHDNRELQTSITELLRVVASASDGDLTVRAPVSVGALGNVSDAFNLSLIHISEPTR